LDVITILEQLTNDPLSGLILAVFLGAMALEAAYSAIKKRDLYQGRDTLTSLSMMLFATVLEIAPKALAVGALITLHEWSPLKDIVSRQWWAWLLLFVLDDFSYYWFHRANHELRWCWAGHVPHHSSVKLNFATALRQGVGERLHKYLFWLWLPLLGFDAVMILSMISISLFYQFWIHTELVRTLPRALEWVFNTPSHHRVHHASNLCYLDRNHGGVLIIWDRLFGTFAAENPDEKPVYGLTKNIDTYNPIAVAAGEYKNLWLDMKRCTHWQDKLRYLWMAPGWSHDGIDHRAQTLRSQLSAPASRGSGLSPEV